MRTFESVSTAAAFVLLTIVAACSSGNTTASVTDVSFANPQVVPCGQLANGCHTGTGTVDVPDFNQAEFIRQMQQARKLSSSSSSENIYGSPSLPSYSSPPPSTFPAPSSFSASASSPGGIYDPYTYQNYQNRSGAFSPPLLAQLQASSSSYRELTYQPSPTPGCTSATLVPAMPLAATCGDAGFTFPVLYGGDCPIVTCVYQFGDRQGFGGSMDF